MTGITLFTLCCCNSAGLRGMSPLQACGQYTVHELPTLGGTVGAAKSINDKGWMAGYANLPTDRTKHAVRWITDAVTEPERYERGTGERSGIACKAQSWHKDDGLPTESHCEIF